MRADQKELKVELRGDRELVATRYFAAPRKLVFDCFTKPELMRRWLTGPEGWTLETIKNDLKVGGKYLYVYADPKGAKMGLYGTFTDVIISEKVANTENFATDLSTFDPDAPENPDATTESRTFTTEGELTLMTHVYRFASSEARELERGAMDGWVALCEALDKLLLELAAV
ncbi:SRPBCC domain-containing protein [Leptospira dzoumogneensis]|uniref:ATPase n=1 Tax=Leptospira dzoumogneensis TaxID=2484904 RepID=A0A4Z1AY54_9LEPT|nr:SRPBCC domain-containing protein [Leptospira dzoumogneensis]TGN02980.1 ATPase [Leptospira dzoumogneensis]